MKLMCHKSSTTLVSPNFCDVFESNTTTDVTLDMEGYKSSHHGHEHSGQTSSLLSLSSNQFPRHPCGPHSSLTNPPLAQTQSASHSPYVPSPASSSSPSSSPAPSPLLRATSEPPPDMGMVGDTSSQLPPSLPQMQEYSWEWGAFPQPSTVKASFSRGGRIESNKALWGVGRKGRTDTVKKSRLSGMMLPSMGASSDNQEQDKERLSGGGLAGRSRSVPPLLEDSPAQKGYRGSREYNEYEDADRRSGPEYPRYINSNVDTENQEREEAIFGFGGTLSASEDDPATLILSIDEKKVEFQLSLAGGGEAKSENNSLKRRGGRDEMEAARLFDSARVDLTKFLDDDNVIRDPRLTIRWARDQYVTCHLALAAANTFVVVDI